MSAIVLDTETTGLSPHHDRVLEIAVVDFDTGETLLHSYLDPGGPIPIEATHIHGLTWDQPTYLDKEEKTVEAKKMLRGCPVFADVALDLATRIQGADAIIGYNVWFDRSMISGEFRRLAQALRDAPVPRWPVVICPKRQWDIHEPKEKRKLENAYKRFVDKKGFDGAHGALPDTLAAREVLIRQLFEFGLEGKDWSEFDPDQKRWVGPSDHIICTDGILYVNFGKYSGKPCHEVEVGYWGWISRQDFPEHVKTIADFISAVKKGVCSGEELYSFAYGRFL